MTVALVTGGGRGVGRVVAESLAAEGFSVAVASRTASELEETARLVEAAGAQALAHVADVTDREAVERLVQAVEAELGPIDLLVSCAGSARAIGPAWETDPEVWWADVESSLRSTYLCAREVAPGMIERGRGRIVGVSSWVGVRPSPYLSAYAAAKAAVVSFDEGLAAALAPHGVQVFTITPGFFRTALTEHLLGSEEGRTWLPEVGSGNWVEPERVARLIAFIASGRADPLSGRFLHALDDLDSLAARADEIARDDLLTVRLRR